MSKQLLNQYLDYVAGHSGSDIHLKAGSMPYARIHGELLPIQNKILSNADIESFAKSMLTPELFNRLNDSKELDHSYLLNEKTRFRVNFFHQINGLGIVMRVIPVHIPTIRELQLPDSIEEFADKKEGLIILTGPTGSGKSTTAAALLNLINHKHRKHIITIEDPVEFIFREEKSVISQRAIGENSRSFENALTAAFREDFDVLFVGEIRDRATMEIALHAANTGHLVVTTLHTKGSAETIGRIINMFPDETQNQVRRTIAEVLIGIVSQRLVANKQKRLVPAVEILKNTSRISEMIHQDRDSEISDAISKGANTYGMQTLDQSLYEQYRKGIITAEEMLLHANNPSDLQLMIHGVGK